MNRNTDIDLAVLHQAIAADISAAFPVFQTVEFYRETSDRSSLPTPACLLEMDDFEEAQGEDPGTGQLAVDMRFCARLVIPFRTPSAKVTIRKLAASFAAFLRHRKWVNPADPAHKLPTSAVSSITASPDDFEPLLDQFEVWRIEWVDRVHLGHTVFIDGGMVPTTVYFSSAPKVGGAHEADYEEV